MCWSNAHTPFLLRIRYRHVVLFRNDSRWLRIDRPNECMDLSLSLSSCLRSLNSCDSVSFFILVSDLSAAANLCMCLNERVCLRVYVYVCAKESDLSLARSPQPTDRSMWMCCRAAHHPFVSLQFLPYEAQFRGIFKFDSILNAALSCEWCVYLKTAVGANTKGYKRYIKCSIHIKIVERRRLPNK